MQWSTTMNSYILKTSNADYQNKSERLSINSSSWEILDTAKLNYEKVQKGSSYHSVNLNKNRINENWIKY